MDKALPCIICGTVLDNVPGDTNQPLGGTSFATSGHYGSTVFDPMNGEQLEITVCDPCAKAAAKDGKIHHHRWNKKPRLWAA